MEGSTGESEDVIQKLSIPSKLLRGKRLQPGPVLDVDSKLASGILPLVQFGAIRQLGADSSGRSLSRVELILVRVVLIG